MKNDQTPLTPEQRIKQLEVQLREATQKAQFFEAVVGDGKKPVGKSSRKSSPKA
jgi:transposase